MHERALTADLVRAVEQVAAHEGATRVVRLRVRLGALSHLTPEHFREHFEDAARGTVVEGADVEAFLDGEIGDERAADVVLEAVEVELPPVARSDR